MIFPPKHLTHHVLINFIIMIGTRYVSTLCTHVIHVDET